MSRSHDIDHEAQQERARFRAIKALMDGCFDDPFLLCAGPLLHDFRGNVEHIASTNVGLPDPDEVDALENECFVIGLRDPKYGGEIQGRFMVMEAAGEKWPEDEWCIVGDDLPALVHDAWSFWADTYDWNK